jgi:putative ABC transport system ATP-binding protein
MSVKERVKSVIQEIKDIYTFLNNQDTKPDDEIKAKEVLIDRFKILKDLNTEPAKDSLIKDILVRLEDWDTLELWFKEVNYLPQSLYNFIISCEIDEFIADAGSVTQEKVEVSPKKEIIKDTSQMDSAEILANVSEQIEREIRPLKAQQELLKNKLESLENEVKTLSQKITTQRIDSKEEAMKPKISQKIRESHYISAESKVDQIKPSSISVKRPSTKALEPFTGKIETDLVLDVRNLTKIYTIGDYTITALDRVDLQIKRGELVAIVGPSGAGKTTLINCLGALDFPDQGQVIYNTDGRGTGSDITTMTDKEHKQIRLHKIGFIFQFYNLFPILTAYENVELPALLAKKSSADIEGKVTELLSVVGLGARMHHKPTQMSGGEQQRVTVARSMVNEPLILLADEPTGELDTETTTQIMEIFLQLRDKGQSILMVTHNRRIAEVADRIITITDGQLVSERQGGKRLAEIWNDEKMEMD